MKIKVSIFAAISFLLILILACVLPVSLVNGSQSIGFDFRKEKPVASSGDTSAKGHVFIHQYEFPADGWITGYAYLNDSEQENIEMNEPVTLLILRPLEGGWLITHIEELPPDDEPISEEGSSRLSFESPIRVHAGEIFGHFQIEKTTGPFPMNIDNDAVDGLTIGRAGFESEDIQEGKFILREGFTGERDYFFNLIYSK